MPPNYPPMRRQVLRVIHRPGIDLDAVIAEKMRTAPFDTTAYEWTRRTAADDLWERRSLTEAPTLKRVVYEVIEGVLKEFRPTA